MEVVPAGLLVGPPVQAVEVEEVQVIVVLYNGQAAGQQHHILAIVVEMDGNLLVDVMQQVVAEVPVQKVVIQRQKEVVTEDQVDKIQ